ncbi:MAG TPA: DUF6428 family protein [Lacunisphaera sp.]|nr:DUF6428 family protein [Lacunisphaera sp.]
MNLNQLRAQLRAHPDLTVAIVLPDGGRIPAHFHVTEVGHVAKKFVDCGGTFRASEACVLQAFAGSAHDDGHRLSAGRLAHILDLAAPILPSGDLPAEVEYEDGIVSQFPLAGTGMEAGELVLQLAAKHTDCLARNRCGLGEDDADGEGSAEKAPCCGGARAASGSCC